MRLRGGFADGTIRGCAAGKFGGPTGRFDHGLTGGALMGGALMGGALMGGALMGGAECGAIVSG
jgi:hypothetical protein